ncbi:PdxT/SNO family [Hysterangium stoloniferum]|nr:PdxT/SNO family [Hysterangium stoloniferum]
MGRPGLTIGVLALQGAFAEHHTILSRLKISHTTINPCLVKTPEDLRQCDALIIPGGESTTIALLARLAGLLDPLKIFVQQKPVWGTCAGAILLSESVQNAKKGGQELLGGISVTIERNGWGSQVESFEAAIEVEALREPEIPFTGVFIRAPVVLDFIENDARPPIQVLARLPESLLPRPEDGSTDDPAYLGQRRVVALRQGRHLLTTFHPELTRDDRFHDYFVRSCVCPPQH